jgi:hypothetical protein
MEAELVTAGFTSREAALLIGLVPIAFARPILEQLGVTEFVKTISAKDKHGNWVNIPLASIPIYGVALSIAREHRSVGLIDHEAYKRIVGRSAPLNAVSKALNAGADVKGATVADALISIRAEDLRESWIGRINRVIFR